MRHGFQARIDPRPEYGAARNLTGASGTGAIEAIYGG